MPVKDHSLKLIADKTKTEWTHRRDWDWDTIEKQVHSNKQTTSSGFYLSVSKASEQENLDCRHIFKENIKWSVF